MSSAGTPPARRRAPGGARPGGGSWPHRLTSTRLTSTRRRRELLAAALALAVIWAGLSQSTLSSFTSVTGTPLNTLTAISLDPFIPATATASRTGLTSCLVSWTASVASGPPAALTYDVTDGSGTTLATAVSGLSTTLTVTSAALTPTIKARVGTWVSAAARTVSASCAGIPDQVAGVGVTPGDASLAVSWTAASGNGSAVTGYTVTATSGGAASTCSSASTSCTVSGLTNGLTYSVQVVASNANGPGPASSAVTAIPYPATIMSAARLKLWLDGADTSTLLASPGCSGATATTTVGCWKDKSTSANHATQNNGAYVPALSTFGGRQVPGFDGSSTYLALSNPSALPNGTTSSTTYLVGSVSDANPATAGYEVGLFWGTEGTGQGRQLYKNSLSATPVTDAYNTLQATTTGAWSASAGILAAEHTSTQVTGWFAGAAPSSVTGNFTTGTTSASVGRQSSTAGYYWRGQIPEVIVFTGTLTGTERRTMDEYLARKWSAVITPQAPSSVSAAVSGSSTTVSWSAPGWDGGAAVTGYTATAVSSLDGSTVTCTAVAPATTCTLTGLNASGAQYTVTVSATNSVGTGPASSSASFTTSAPYPANLKLWLAADDLDGNGTAAGASESGLVSGAVQTWKDKSGNGFDVTAPSSGERPGYNTQTLNGYHTVTFNGSTVLQGTGTGIYGITGDRTQFVVTRPRTWASGTTNAGSFVADRNTNTNGLFGLKVTTGGAWALQTRSDSDPTLATLVETAAAKGPVAGQPDILEAERSSSTNTLTVDGALQTTGTNASTITQPTISVGRHLATSTSADLDVAEVLLYNRALTSTETRAVERYLAVKWGVTIPPDAPTAVTLTPASSALGVSWTAPAWTGGSAVTDYTIQYRVTGTSPWTTLVDGVSTATTAVITGLTPGTSYDVQVLAVNAAGTGPASSTAIATADTSWDPTILGSTVGFWVDANDTSTLTTSSGAVSAWNDKSGNARNATQATSAKQPTLVAASMGGKQSITFNGSTATMPFNGTFLAGTDYTVAAAVARTSSASPMFYLGGTASSTDTNLHLGWWTGTTMRNGQYGDDCDSTVAAFGTETPQVQVVSRSTTARYTYLDGSQTCTRVGTALSGWAGAAIGNLFSYYYTGRVGEIVIATSALSTSDRQTLEGYLAWKWGSQAALPAGHPYKTYPPGVPLTTPSAPINTTATAGDATATVTWTQPAWNGGSTITSYTATATPSDTTLPTLTCTTAASPCTITSLTNGATYTVTVTATNAQGTGTPSTGVSVVPVPTLLSSSSVKVWLDAQNAASLNSSAACSGSNVSTGSAVLCWKDRSASGWNAVRGSTVPVLTANAINGRQALRFVKTNPDYYDITSAGIGAVGSADRSVFAVTAARTTYGTDVAGGTNNAGLVAGWTTWNSGILAKNAGASTSVSFFQADGYKSTGPTLVAAATSSATNPAVVSSVFSSSGGTLTTAVGLNGAGATSTSSLAGTWYAYGDAFRIGSAGTTASSSYAYPLDGDIGEILVLNKAVTASERRIVEEYLARRWGLSIAPAEPSGVTAVPGPRNAAISWAAPTWDGGSTITSYTVTASPGGATCTATFPATTCTVSGLSVGSTYAFTVTATNSVGTGPASSASGSVTVAAAPAYVWGKGLSGAAGTLLMASSTSSAVRMPGTESWASVSNGYQHSCGLTTAGALYCWGANTFGQLGDGTTTQRWEPVAVSSGTVWSSVSAGYDSTCAIRSSDSTAWCWGYATWGGLGNGGISASYTPVQVSTTGVTTWSKVSVGKWFACGLKTDSTLWCWGYNSNGQLGDTTTTARTTPVQVTPGTSYSTVTTAWASACAIKVTGSTAWCWGTGASGQLGNGGTSDSSSPVAVSGGKTWASISGGSDFYCALVTDSSLDCWGYNADGELGINSTTQATTPTEEDSGSSQWAQVQGFYHSTCARTKTGTLKCWGNNISGQLGDGTTTNRTVPTASGTSTAWTSISGGYTTMCGIRSDASIWCQGSDANGELGQYWGQAIGAPTPLQGPSGTWTTNSWTSASPGVNGSCAIADAGSLWCWGANLEGEAGDGTTTQRNYPVQAGAATTWASISAGTQTVCGIQTDASMWCWGSTVNGQTGISGASGNKTVPTAGPAGSWSSVSVGDTHTCGIKTDGTLWCWGANASGQLGLGNTTTFTTPQQVTVSGITTWSSVSAGAAHTCAIAATGTHPSALYCWGENNYGQVGNASTTDVTSPTRPDSNTWSAVATGNLATCAIRATGGLYCWGQNNYGQLGQGGTANSPTYLSSPTQVGNLTTWTDVGAGDGYSCAVRVDSTVWCWGHDDYRQLGDRNAATTQTSVKQVTGLTATWIDLHGKAADAVSW